MKELRISAFRLSASFLILVCISFPGISQVIDLSKYQEPFNAKGIAIYHLNADSLYAEKQNVVIAEISNEALSRYRPGIAYADSVLKKTSRFGEETKAIVALNGSFFNVEKGGSVAYLESDGKIIARNRNSKEKWAKIDSLLNGAIVLDYQGNLKIEVARPEAFYENSDKEKAVLFSGPALLANGQKLPLENSGFVNKRHPRSCLCKTEHKSILFVAIDGRSEAATGMNLKEVQQFLLRLNCRDAINLDGGGSTTLWINDGTRKEIINNPSDKEGERPVANILLIKE
jgi:exopolysaccharide biosynthesis protein